MPRRAGVYIVPTHRWYIERTVWLIAGGYLLSATALAALRDPLWVLAIITMGIASVTVALTGFCVIGNALKQFGFTPLLGRRSPTPHDLYFMQTDRWYLERRIYLAVGINISIASVLTLVHSMWWLAFTGFVGVAMVWFAATGFCIMANGLYWLGAEPRLGRACEAELSGGQESGVRSQGWKGAAALRASGPYQMSAAAELPRLTTPDP